ncbi:hypothetical protein V493_04216 [Pseudogymnoascus sp. VKM F-4281 (FW-2241)]|nr:hypothetical protein V493_04216 [Pseudogymnoascus sp. VKM F-4281 (FW-2241)]
MAGHPGPPSPSPSPLTQILAAFHHPATAHPTPPPQAPHCPVQRVGSRPKAASGQSPAALRRQQPECRLSTNAPLGGRARGDGAPVLVAGDEG